MRKDQDPNRFYIYAHWRNDTGGLFYIGKGCRDRAAQTVGRSALWKNIVNKVGFTFSILFDRMTEEQAFEKEKELIKQYGRKSLGSGPLINFSEGGQGHSGYKQSEKTKEAKSIRFKGVKRPLSFCIAKSSKQNIKKNKLGYYGIYKNNQKYIARIRYFKKLHYLGVHATPEEAAAAYDKKALELFGPDTVTNFPKENYK